MTISTDLLYGYYINLDERGCFYADVRNHQGTTVFEIKTGGDLLDDLDFDDYNMKHKNDIQGLEKFLKECQIIKPTGHLLKSCNFEQYLDSDPEFDEDDY
jgi:hypothetical protein